MAGRGAGDLEGTHHHLPPLQCQGNDTEHCIVGTSDFDTQMSGIKFWKGDENLRPVYKKTVSRKIERLLAF